MPRTLRDILMGNNLHFHSAAITRQQRQQLNGHKALCVWFTGLSGSGKSTIANEVMRQLHASGIHTYLLDGDNTRLGLNKDLGFGEEHRRENIRRIGEVCKLMCDAGLVVLTAFISPFEADREQVRTLLEKGSFIEIFVRCKLDTCEQRDPKGLYRKARAGQLKDFTGIDSPYEEPVSPELVVDSGLHDADTCARQVLDFLKQRLKPEDGI